MDGRLEEHFSGVGFKRLSAVDCIGEGISNQQELNASARMREFLGEERRTFTCRYIHITGSIEALDYVDETSTITYYNSREGKPRAAEFRLTYPASSEVMRLARAGDWCWLLRDANQPEMLMIVVVDSDSPVAGHLDRLFGTGLRDSEETQGMFQLGDLGDSNDADLDVDEVELLTLLGVQPEITNANALDRVIAEFGERQRMPSSRELAQFTRRLCDTTDPTEDPDRTLWDWYSLTTEMFFGLEERIIGPVIDAHLANRTSIDLEGFFALATKYKNSRYSRAGVTFEAHWAALLEARGLTFQVMAKTPLPDGSRPDFLFPGLRAYMDPEVPVDLMTFLAAKTSTKERWMQVVAEAPRIRERHLATLDKELTSSVLASMENKQVIPVLPEPVIHMHYSDERGAGLMNVRGFLDMLTAKERELGSSAGR